MDASSSIEAAFATLLMAVPPRIVTPRFAPTDPASKPPLNAGHSPAQLNF